ncbi:unnamed protein product, partial [Didymodactylos carnosus]
VTVSETPTGTTSSTAAPMLPGIEEIACGFEAVKMQSTLNLGETKHPLFDLSQRDETYTFSVGSQKQTYSTSSLVQITDMKIKTEKNADSISSTYEEFFHRYN